MSTSQLRAGFGRMRGTRCAFDGLGRLLFREEGQGDGPDQHSCGQDHHPRPGQPPGSIPAGSHPVLGWRRVAGWVYERVCFGLARHGRLLRSGGCKRVNGAVPDGHTTGLRGPTLSSLWRFGGLHVRAKWPKMKNILSNAASRSTRSEPKHCGVGLEARDERRCRDIRGPWSVTESAGPS